MPPMLRAVRALRYLVATACLLLVVGAARAAHAPDFAWKSRGRALAYRVSSAIAPTFRKVPAQPAAVTFTITPTVTFPVSRFIYGANFLTDDGVGQAGFPPWYGATLPRGISLNRLSGNRFSAYNWRLNASNAGRDYRFQNDRYLGPSEKPGEAVRSRVVASTALGAGVLVTVPMLPFVAANALGIELDTLEANAETRIAKHFVPNRPTRGPADAPGTIYQDEFVRWLSSAVPAFANTTKTPPFFSLDNEPDIWHDTHQEVMSRMSGQRALQTYDGFIGTSVEYARAIKRELPQAIIFGPAVATYAGVETLGRYPSPDPVRGTQSFFEYYLQRMRVAETRDRRRLLDVLDLHWYPASGSRSGGITNDLAPQNEEMIQARLQAPRSLWDPTFDERTWVTQTTAGPVALIPRLRQLITQHYPGTKIAISEYYFGRSGDISGGVAQADVLGIFGREGVYAAALWPQANVFAPPYAGSGEKAYAYAFGAFKLFRDYDGAGATFGDIGVRAKTSDAVHTSVYASIDTGQRLIVVAINKTAAPVSATLNVSGPAFAIAEPWLMSEGMPVPSRQPDVRAATGQGLVYLMPPMSASTLVLRR